MMKSAAFTITSAFVLLLLPGASSAQPDLRWARFQDGFGKADFIADVHVDSGGNIYVAGWTTNPSDNRDYYIGKYDPAGTPLWYHLYDNGGDDEARSIAVKGTAVYVTGTSSSGTGFGAHKDIVSFVLDAAGTIVPGNANALRFDFAGKGRDDEAVRILPAPDVRAPGLFVSALHADTSIADTFLVAGTHSDTASASRDLLLLKYDGTGLISAASHHAPGDETLAGMAAGAEGELYLGATTSAGGGSPYSRMMVVRFGPDLAFGWERLYSNDDLDFLLGIAADETGVYVTGTSFSLCGDRDVAVVTYAPDGGLRWSARMYDCLSTQVGTGGILVDGTTVYAAGYHANGSQYFALEKSGGTVRYQAESPVQSSWNSLVRSYGGNVYAGGHKVFYDLPFDGVQLAKFDDSGIVQWDVQYDASGSGGANEVSGMVSGGPDSSIVLVGSVTAAGQRDMMILKYGVGESTLTGIGATGPRGGLPASFELLQNYPNPFNSTTILRYRLPVRSEVSIRLYDLLGREVTVVAQGMEDPGEKEAVLTADRLPSGVYFCRMRADGNVSTIKVLLLR